MKTQISNKALTKAFEVRNLSNVSLFKDEVGVFTFSVKTDNGIIEKPEYEVAPHGTKFSDKTPATWADEIKAILEKHPAIEETVTEKAEEATGIKNDPELQAEITEKSHKAFKESPIMKQLHQLKGKHPEAILLFRNADFYITYNCDAEDASKILGIVLTTSKNGYKTAGFPSHTLDAYLPKLVSAGKRIAICDMIEDTKTKTVKRGITEIIKEGGSVSTTETKTEEPVENKPEEKKPAEKTKSDNGLDKIKKVAGRCYRMFNAFAIDDNYYGEKSVNVCLKYKNRESWTISMEVTAEGIKKLSYFPVHSISMEDTICIDYLVRLGYLLRDNNRLNKVAEAVKSYLQESK